MSVHILGLNFNTKYDDVIIFSKIVFISEENPEKLLDYNRL